MRKVVARNLRGVLHANADRGLKQMLAKHAQVVPELDDDPKAIVPEPPILLGPPAGHLRELQTSNLLVTINNNEHEPPRRSQTNRTLCGSPAP